MSESVNIKIFLSGRDSASGEIASNELPSLVQFSAANNQKDVERYVNREVDLIIHEKRLLHGRVSELLRRDIVRDLDEGANGMYV